MADIVSASKRSKMMAGIKGKNTKPELIIRSLLHREGFRYRLHAKNLPGKPDLVFPKYRAVIFVHGCFWHGHNCHLFKWPKSRPEFWREKIEGNQKRDSASFTQLMENGWRICTIWECALKGSHRKSLEDVRDLIIGWLLTDSEDMEIAGN
jgi:DNA mismatch endonuclease (patch repair protein)